MSAILGDKSKVSPKKLKIKKKSCIVTVLLDLESPRVMHSNKYKYVEYWFSKSWNRVWNLRILREQNDYFALCTQHVLKC